MPKLKEDPMDKKLRQLVAKIRYGMSLYHVDMYELSAVAQMHRVTLHRKFNNPEEFRLKELINISRKLHIDLIDFGEGL